MRAHFLLLTAYAIIITSATPNNTEHVKSQISDTGSLSKPIIQCSHLDNNTMHITCFSESGPLPIRYRLFLHESMLQLQEKVINKPEPAKFIITMTPVPGTQIYFNCTAISSTGETSSSNLTLKTEDSTGVAEETEIDQKDKDTGPEYLIPLQHILTSVTPEVLDWNNLLLMICGPVVLIILVIVITISYLRSQKEQHMDV